MSGGAASSGGTMVGVSVDNAGFPALGRAARAVFVTARASADEHGIVDDRAALGPLVGLSAPQLRHWFGVLEQERFDGRPLCRRRGARELWVLLVDAPGIPPRVRRETSAVVEQGSGGHAPGSGGWREMRARVGGLQRAIIEVQEQRDAAKAEADALRRGRRLEANAPLVGLLEDLTHATDCPVPLTCKRCEAIARRVEERRAEYVAETEIVERLERAGAIEAAGTELLDAVRDRSVGAMQRRAAAAAALARAVNGDELRAGG
jgi:hypothetical protein